MSRLKTRKELEKIAIVTESPDDCRRTHDAVDYIMEPLEEQYRVARFSILDTDPKNGKAATKTEIKHNRDKIWKSIAGCKYVILVGNTPLQAITGKAGISKLRGKPIKQDGFLFLPMNNPGIIPPGHPLYTRKNSVQTLQTENSKLQKENLELKKEIEKLHKENSTL